MPGRVDVAAAQVRHQQVAAAEHVQRQVAVMIVVAVEEASFLLPVQRHVGGVEVQHQTLRPPALRRHELVEQHPVQADRVRPRRGLLPTTQGGRTGQHRVARGRRLQPGIVAQGLVVVEIFVAQHQRVQALSDQRYQPVLAARLAPRIMEHPRRRLTQTEAPVDLEQQRAAAVAGDVAAAELDLDLASCEAWKRQRTLVAFRHGGVALLSDFNTLILEQFPPSIYPHLCIIRASSLNSSL